jgi:hypothetical protein
MSDDELVTLLRFSNPVEADLALARLEDAGIRAAMSGDQSTNVLSLGYTSGGIDILVPRSELERARQILEEIVVERREAHDDPPEPEEAEAPKPRGEALVERAWRSMLLGFLICSPVFPVLHFYAIFCLLEIVFGGHETKGAAATKFYVSFVVCAISIAGGHVFVLSSTNSITALTWLIPAIALAAILYGIGFSRGQ